MCRFAVRPEKGIFSPRQRRTDADGLHDLIDHVIARTEEIEQDALIAMANFVPPPVSEPAEAFTDFVIPSTPASIQPEPDLLPDPETDQTPEPDDEWQPPKWLQDYDTWVNLPTNSAAVSAIASGLLAAVSLGIAAWLPEDSIIGLGAMFFFFAFGAWTLFYLARFAVSRYGWKGFFLKLALLIDGLFVCYVMGFHETPWSFLSGAPFPGLAHPAWPFIVTCVFTAGILVIPEGTEWVLAKTSRHRLVHLFAVAIIVITFFVVRARLNAQH